MVFATVLSAISNVVGRPCAFIMRAPRQARAHRPRYPHLCWFPSPRRSGDRAVAALSAPAATARSPDRRGDGNQHRCGYRGLWARACRGARMMNAQGRPTTFEIADKTVAKTISGHRGLDHEE